VKWGSRNRNHIPGQCRATETVTTGAYPSPPPTCITPLPNTQWHPFSSPQPSHPVGPRADTERLWPAPWSPARRMRPCPLQLLETQWQVQPQAPDIRTERAGKQQGPAGKYKVMLYSVQLCHLRMATLWVPLVKWRLMPRQLMSNSWQR